MSIAATPLRPVPWSRRSCRMPPRQTRPTRPPTPSPYKEEMRQHIKLEGVCIIFSSCVWITSSFIYLRAGLLLSRREWSEIPQIMMQPRDRLSTRCTMPGHMIPLPLPQSNSCEIDPDQMFVRFLARSNNMNINI